MNQNRTATALRLDFFPARAQSGSPAQNRTKKNPTILSFANKYVGQNGLYQIKHRFTIGGTRSMSGDSLFADEDTFRVSFKRLGNFNSPMTGSGNVIAYRATKQLKPLAVLSAACDADKKETLRAFEYVEVLKEMEMAFSLSQIENILLDRTKWDILNLEGGSNVFLVLSRDKCYIVIARRVGKMWHLKDSYVGMGRGYDAGVQFLFRNKTALV